MQVWQNMNNWSIVVKAKWVLIILFLKLFCTFDIFQTKELGGNQECPSSKGYEASFLE